MAKLKGGTYVAGSMTVEDGITAASFSTAAGTTLAYGLNTLSGQANYVAKFVSSGVMELTKSIISDNGSTATVAGELTATGDIKGASIYIEEDANSSYFLRLLNNSGLTANRTLTINTNNADRTLTLAGNLQVDTALQFGSTLNTASRVLYTSAAGVVSGEAQLAIARGGTGAASVTARCALLGPAIDGAPTWRAITFADISDKASAATGITSVGTIATGVWNGSIISSTYGGTGVNNGGRTLTIATSSGTIAFTSNVTLSVTDAASISGINTGDNPGVTSVTGTDPIISSGGNTPAISISKLTGTVSGYVQTQGSGDTSKFLNGAGEWTTVEAGVSLSANNTWTGIQTFNPGCLRIPTSQPTTPANGDIWMV
jgi:hypothetical protein